MSCLPAGHEQGDGSMVQSRQCQIILQACPSFVSTMLFLPLSICFLSARWLMGGSLVEYHVNVSPVRVACSGSALSSGEQRQSETRERHINWRVSRRAVFIPWFPNTRKRQSAGMMLQPNIVSKCLYGMMRRFHPLEGAGDCCDEGLLTTRKRLQSGNWQQAGSTPPSMSTNVPRCCSSRSVGYSFACQEKLMHKQRCHIHIGLPTESFHHGAVRLTTSAGGTWQYHHNMCS